MGTGFNGDRLQRASYLHSAAAPALPAIIWLFSVNTISFLLITQSFFSVFLWGKSRRALGENAKWNFCHLLFVLLLFSLHANIR